MYVNLNIYSECGLDKKQQYTEFVPQWNNEYVYNYNELMLETNQ